MKTAALLLLALALASPACDKNSEVVDVVPPAPPNPALVTITGPDGQGRLTVSGAAGAVEASATVIARNVTADGASHTANATGAGSFQLMLPGAFLDEIELRARDAAGNTSTNYITLVAGAPFTLEATSGLDQSAEVGSVLDEPLVFTLLDGGMSPVSGVTILFDFAVGDGSFDPVSAVSDAQGQVSTELTLSTSAGQVEVAPYTEAFNIDELESIFATALPGAPVAIVWITGDGQKDGPSETLLVDPVVAVQDSYGNGIADVALNLAASGGGSALPASGSTDAQGSLSCAWTLGGGYGEQFLTASTAGLPDAVASAFVDDAPVIDSVNPITPVDPGDLIYLDGDNYCATASYNDLRLGETPLAVVSATEIHLSARVPAGLAPGSYAVNLSVGHQDAPAGFSVEVVQPLGEVTDYPFVSGEVQVEFLVPGNSTRYAVIPYNASLSGTYPPLQAGYGVGSEAFFAGLPGERTEDAVADFQRRLLALHSEGARLGEGERGAADRRLLYCLNTAQSGIDMQDPANYDALNATEVYSGSHTLIYLDDEAAGSISPANLAALGDRFDDFDYGIDVAAFGQPSDIDGNGKVNILLTPVVNRMTTWSDGSYIGGFFNPIDLLAGQPAGTSNGGEFFYALVPDPSGWAWDPVGGGPALSEEQTVDALQSIFAHEFQHMINMARRVAQGYPPETLWLNEGLSHLAENLCGYHDQNRARVAIYLRERTHNVVSLTLGGNSLHERGASYLFCRYLQDRWPNLSLDLVSSAQTGTDNVAQGTGESFTQLFKDWTAAIYLDDRDLDGEGGADDLGPVYRFDSHNIRVDFPHLGETGEPLSIPELYFHDPAYMGGIVPTGMDYLHFAVAGGESPPPGGSSTLTFTGELGSDMGVLVLRVY